MSNCRLTIIKTIAIIFSLFILFSSFGTCVAKASNYSDTVKLTEDTIATLQKGVTKYNNVDYSKAPWYYNPYYYFLNYADLREAYGADPQKLLEHYVNYGIKEKRVADRELTRGAQAYSSKTEYVVPRYQLTQQTKDGMVVIPEEIHTNGGMNKRQETEARTVAKQLAEYIFNRVTTNGGGTQIEMVAYATGIVRAYCDIGKFNENYEGKIYRTAYGVFVARDYTSAGATRALGLILDYLDEIMTNITNDPNDPRVFPPLKWVHVNANKYEDQWCQIVCDNHEAYADPIKAQAGYGVHPNWGGKKQDIQSYVNFAGENDIFNTRPPYADGQYKITNNGAANSNPMSETTDSYYKKTGP